MNNKKIPTILGIFLLVLGVGAGVFLVQRTQSVRIGASPESAPQDLRISNISDSTFTVSFTTQKNTITYIEWGDTPQMGNTTTANSDPQTTHLTNVRGLDPNKDYYFEVFSDGKLYDNNGIPWKVRTGPTLGTPLDTKVISGNVVGKGGEPIAGALVEVSGNFSRLSTQTSSSGSWIIPITIARNIDLSTYAQLDENTELEILVQAGSAGIANAKTKLSLANPTPTIVLGESHDFRNKDGTQKSSLPTSSISLPEESTPSSGFEVTEVSPAAIKSLAVTVDSVEEGEVITSTQPEFFGSGPSGTVVEIVVESDPIFQTTTRIGTGGTWSWSPPSTLKEGVHTITVRWTDENGVLRSIKRSFVVQAAEDSPSFESTPSGQTPSPSPIQSPTPTPQSSATPTASPKATPTQTPAPRISVPSTESGIPDAGNPLPTIAIALAALFMITGGAILSKHVFD